MFTERVKSSFATNEPIYTEEIIGLFPDYSRPQIFRFIREAEEKKEIVNFAKGLECDWKMKFPKKNFWNINLK